jgi:hypothetical protein
MLAVLMPALAPALLQQTPVLIAALQKTPCGRTWSASRQRQALWGHCLQVAALGGQHYPALAAFYQAVLERFAMESGINLGVLMADMAQVLQSGQVANSQPLQATLAAQHGSAPAPARVNPALAQALIRLQRGSAGALLAAWSQLRAQLAGLSASLQAQLPQALAGKQQQAAAQVLALLQQNHPMPQPKPLPELVRLFEIALADSNQPESELAACLRRLQSHGGPLNEVWSALRAICWQLPAPAQHNWLAALSGAAAAQFDAASALSRLLAGPQSSHGLRAEACARLQHMLHNDAGAAQARQNRFAAVEELSVGNAGLVILWPFLSSFFAHLGLLEENNFKDLAARQRAVGLLQLLAAEESSFPEYLLPLNKVLCGLELQHPFGFGPPPKKREIRECSQLLAAVIAQAPILNNMSEAGFRGSFLLRPGLLSRRDGHWLLRVERQTYDIVLERFPWSWSWVKLPWMADPLRVEW